MKKLKVGDKELFIAEHKGDIIYSNYVKFKQYVPQFWEKMDSPMFMTYFERIQDLFNQSKFTQALMVLNDYKLALDNSKNSYDAWGMCFALIACDDKEGYKRELTELDCKDKLKAWPELTPDVIVEEVLSFMKASPETFQDHLIAYGLLGSMIETESLDR